VARASDELVNPVTGLRTIFRKISEDTNGELLQVDWIGSPGWSTGPDHVHRRQEERFEVLSGKLGPRVEGVARVLEEGEEITAPAGSAHAAWNAERRRRRGARPRRFKPALRTEVAFETLAGLARDGKTDSAGAPKNPLLLALIMREYEDEIYFVRPPLFVQRVVFGALAGVARLLGYRAEYPLPVSQAERALPDRDVTRRSTGRSGVIGTFGGFHARNKKNARKERSTRNGSKV
jgi:quercetin dioxygenase-like cupin family protein